MFFIIFANPKLVIIIVAIIIAILVYLYCYPMPVPCIPCCEPNCSMIGTFTYCMKGTGPETTMCPAIEKTTKIFKNIYNLIKSFIDICNTIISKITNALQIVFEKIASVIETIANIVDLDLGLFDFFFKINLTCKVAKVDVCNPIEKLFDTIVASFKTILDEIIVPVIDKVKEIGGIIRKKLAPIVTFVTDIIVMIVGPLFRFIKHLVLYMYYLLVFLKNILFADFPSYIYWKFMWKIQKIFPFVPVQFVPALIAIIVTSQITGGMIGLTKMTALPANFAKTIPKLGR